MRQFSIPLTIDQRRSSGYIGCSTYEFRTLVKSKDNTTMYLSQVSVEVYAYDPSREFGRKKDTLQ